MILTDSDPFLFFQKIKPFTEAEFDARFFICRTDEEKEKYIKFVENDSITFPFHISKNTKINNWSPGPRGFNIDVFLTILFALCPGHY